MMKKIIALAFCFCSLNTLAQNNNAIKYSILNQEEVYRYTEEMPEFIGGEDKLFEFIFRNIKYPKSALKKELQGKVNCEFIVQKDGSLTDFKIIKSLSKDCDAEVIRVIKSMPNWKPAKLNGKFVKAFFTLPITFSLN